MNVEKLNEFVLEYNNVYKFNNENILHNLIETIQTNINFAFALESDKKEKLFPKLVLSEDYEDIASNITHSYKQPNIYISLKNRSPISEDQSNKFKTFSHSNIISGIPRFYKREQIDDKIYEYANMCFDNRFELILLTKNIKEQLELINILERALNIYSNIIKSNYIIASGITSIQSSAKKTDDSLTKTIITFEIRTTEVVTIDKNYILTGYKIFTNELTTGSGEINDNNEWEDYPENGEYISFP
jgi:hypothetical protein